MEKAMSEIDETLAGHYFEDSGEDVIAGEPAPVEEAEEAPVEEAEEAPVEEAPVEEEAPAPEININLFEEAKPTTFRVTILGPLGQMLPYGINGVMGSLPMGVEIEVSEPVYHAIKGAIKNEER